MKKKLSYFLMFFILHSAPVLHFLSAKKRKKEEVRKQLKLKETVKICSSLGATDWDQLTLSANHGISPGSQRGKIFIINKKCQMHKIQSSSCIKSQISNPSQTEKIQFQLSIKSQKCILLSKYKIHLKTVKKDLEKISKKR